MDNTSLKTILNDYERHRIYEINALEDRRNDLYTRFPRLKEIEAELSSSSISIAKNLIKEKNQDLLNNLNTKIDSLKQEKSSILKSIGKDDTYLKLHYNCDICKDTGYITDGFKTVKCNCLKQKIFDLEYNKSNISNLKNQDFSKFKSTFYSETVDKNKYKADISPRENIEIIKNICQNFIKNFDDPNEKNLLFTGNTGLGKTFLSSCIANEILKSGKTVLYQTSPVMFDTIIDYRFGKNTSNIYNSILDVDLLIIDDLGTESMNSLKFSELFNIINTRLLNQNNHCTKTIISTNLNLQNMFKSYDERIISRFVGNYNICRFFGDDIRFLKK